MVDVRKLTLIRCYYLIYDLIHGLPVVPTNLLFKKKILFQDQGQDSVLHFISFFFSLPQSGMASKSLGLS